MKYIALILFWFLLSCCGYEADYSIHGLQIVCETRYECPERHELVEATDAIAFQYFAQVGYDCYGQWGDHYRLYFVDEIDKYPEAYGMVDHGRGEIYVRAKDGDFLDPDVLDWELGNACLHRYLPSHLRYSEIHKWYFRQKHNLKYGYGRAPR